MSWFIFNGIDSRNMPIVVREAVPVIRAEERVKHITVSGRTGDLTLTEGDHVFNPYMQTIPIYVRGESNVREVFKWLSGEGYLTINTDPYVKQMARVINAITMDRPTYHKDYFEGNIVFYCQPTKYVEGVETPTLVSNDTQVTVQNRGSYRSYPRIIVYYGGSADILLRVNGKEFTLQTTKQERKRVKFLIDSEAQEVARIDENENPVEIVTHLSIGDFPVLEVGANTVFVQNGGTTSVNRTRVFPRARYA